MKTFISAIAILFIFNSISFAQLKQGSVHISASSDLSFASLKTRAEYDGQQMGEEVSSSNFSITPTIGYFVADNFVLGLSFNHDYSKTEDVVVKSTLIGPYAIYYLGSSNIRPFLGADIGFGSQNNDGGVEEFKADAVGYNIGGGVAVFLGDNVSLDFGLFYGNITLSSPDDSKAKIITDGIGATGGFSVYF